MDPFEEGLSRRFISCDKVREELPTLFPNASQETKDQFWEGYRWQPPETKLKVARK